MKSLIAALAVGVVAMPMLTSEVLAQQRGSGGPQARFDTFDKDADGVVTRDEMSAYRSARFKQKDLDGDGKLSIDEMKAAQAQRRQARLEQRFEAMDTDGDGFVSEAELSSRGTPFFDRFDANSDGKVTRDEVATARRGGSYGGRGRSPGHQRGW